MIADFRFWLWSHRFHGRKLVDESGTWYTADKPIVWAHAGGGRLHEYGNSKEAIDDSIAHGIKVLELDVAVTSDGVPVLTHWFRPGGKDIYGGRPTLQQFKSTLIEGKYTPLTLQELFDQYQDYDGYFAIDPYYVYREGWSFDLVAWLEAHATKRQLKHIIYQIPWISYAPRFKDVHSFASLHCSLPVDIDRAQNVWRLRCYIRVLTSCGVRSVSLGNRPIAEATARAIAMLRRSGIHVSIVDVDTLEECRAWMKIGADVFNSRLLYPAIMEGCNG